MQIALGPRPLLRIFRVHCLIDLRFCAPLSGFSFPRPPSTDETFAISAAAASGLAHDADAAATRKRDEWEEVNHVSNEASVPLLSGENDYLPVALYLVATPIGNLDDITVRALQVLKSVHTIFAEDVWHSRKLLTHYKITTHIKSYHAHNEAKRASIITSLLDRGLSVAVISDAGVPGVSDPGAAAVKAAIEASHKVVPIPGPCAAVTALVASGLPTTTFHFEGFLSAKRAARRKRLLELRLHIQATMVFYVPPHRAVENLQDMSVVLGGKRRCCAARELTKVFETFERGTLESVLATFISAEPRGELTLVVGGSTEAELNTPAHIEESLEEHLKALLQQGHSVASASKKAAPLFRVRKKVAYEVAVKVQHLAAAESQQPRSKEEAAASEDGD